MACGLALVKARRFRLAQNRGGTISPPIPNPPQHSSSAIVRWVSTPPWCYIRPIFMAYIALLQAQGIVPAPPQDSSSAISRGAKRVYEISSVSPQRTGEGPSKRKRLDLEKIDDIKPKVNDEDEGEDEDDLNVLKVRKKLLKDRAFTEYRRVRVLIGSVAEVADPDPAHGTEESASVVAATREGS